MALSKIVLTWTGEPLHDDVVGFDRRIIGGGGEKSEDIIFRDPDPRWSQYSCPTRLQIGPAGEQSMLSWLNWFNNDYNIGIYDITILASNQCQIQFKTGLASSWEFYNFNDTSGFVSALITNEVLPTFSYVDAWPYGVEAPATDICNDVKITLETDVLATEIYLNGVLYDGANTLNPAEIEFPRATTFYIELRNAGGDKLYYPIDQLTNFRLYNQYYDLLSAVNLSVKVTTSVLGATVTVNSTNVNNLVLEYSLNDADWTTNNIFTGQADGIGKTMYVRDQFGCKVNFLYDVTAFGTREPYLFISEALSVLFKESVEWDECTIFKNDENTLAHQGIESIKDCSKVLFATCDTTRLQIKSNYDTVIMKLRKEDLSEVVITTEQMSDNLNKFKKMDAWYYNYNEQYVGIYFESGWTYDEFGTPLEEYALNGNLPDFAIIGGEVTMPGFGTQTIVDVIFDEAKKKKAILIEYTYSGIDTPIIIESVYDLLPYEVYEFEIDWSLYTAGVYDLLLENTDTANGTVLHLSENIYLEEEHADTVAIRYWNDNNRDIFYKYGIENFIRVPLEYKKLVAKDEVDINITDDSTSVISSLVVKAHEFSFTDLVGDQAHKLTIALSCDNLFIQGIGYAKDSGVKLKGGGTRNNYDLVATLVKKGINYTNNRQGQGEVFDDSGFDIPAFITDGEGFIKT